MGFHIVFATASLPSAALHSKLSAAHLLADASPAGREIHTSELRSAVMEAVVKIGSIHALPPSDALHWAAGHLGGNLILHDPHLLENLPESRQRARFWDCVVQTTSRHTGGITLLTRGDVNFDDRCRYCVPPELAERLGSGGVTFQGYWESHKKRLPGLSHARWVIGAHSGIWVDTPVFSNPHSTCSLVGFPLPSRVSVRLREWATTIERDAQNCRWEV